jgi:OOP family OmpA-OmpF porin
MSRKQRIAVCLWFTFYVAVAFGVTTGEKVKLEGLVASRQNDFLIVRTADSGDIVVQVTAFTKVVTPYGWFEKRKMPVTDLVPGLWVKVQGVGNSLNHVLATQVSFSGKDLRTAKAIQAGLIPLDTKVQSHAQQIQTNAQDIQANHGEIQANRQNIQSNQQRTQQLDQRFSELAEYDVKYTAAVYFPVGSATLSPEGRNQLAELARNAQALKGYLIQVKGYTDSTGPVALNQELSIRRAQSVIAFLEERGSIPLTHVLTPGGMGESGPAASNKTSSGRSENRRVEVKVLINRGLAGE